MHLCIYVLGLFPILPFTWLQYPICTSKTAFVPKSNEGKKLFGPRKYKEIIPHYPIYMKLFELIENLDALPGGLETGFWITLVRIVQLSLRIGLT